MVLGIALGILIGLLSGVVFELFMDASRSAASDLAGVLKIISGLLAIPAFWFGGSWLATSAILKDVDVTKIRSAYVVTLACVFTPFVLWELYRRRGRPPTDPGAARIAVGGGGDA
jgi:hypothetical protein